MNWTRLKCALVISLITKIDYLPATSEDQFNIEPVYKTFQDGRQILKELNLKIFRQS